MELGQLPLPARLKFSMLVEAETQAHDANNAAFARTSTLARARHSCPDPELPELEREIERSQAKMRAANLRYRDAAAIGSSLRFWITAASGIFEMHDPIDAKPDKGETIKATVDRLRVKLNDLQREMERVQQAALPRDELKRQASAWIEHKRSTVAVKISAGHNQPFKVTIDPTLVGLMVPMLDIAASFCWLDPSMMEQRIHAFIDKMPSPPLSMTTEQRDKSLAKIAQEMLDTERMEEALICQSEEQGVPISRRASASPYAVLGLRKPLPRSIPRKVAKEQAHD
jgi:hypothetical protein